MQNGSVTFHQHSFWNLLLRRFFTFYLLLFIFPFPLQFLPYIKFIDKWYNRLIAHSVAFIGKHVFLITFPLVPTNNGSGDTTYNCVWLFVLVVLAMVTTVAYSIADKKGKWDIIILYWLTVYIRFFFAFILMRYGLEKDS